MEKTYLYEAFKQLSVLNEEDFNLSETDGIDELTSFDPNAEVEAKDDAEVDIIDPEANEEVDLKDSYIGKVILDCNVCHSKMYKDKADIKLSEDDEDIVNIEEECPFCLSSDGYRIIGEVIPFGGLEEQPVEEQPVDPVEDDLGADVAPESEAEIEKPVDEEPLNEEKECEVCPECGKNPCECDKECCKEQDLNESVQVGDTIKIIDMGGEPEYCGKVGQVTHIDDAGQIHGTWGGCALIPEEDHFEIVEKKSLDEDVHIDMENKKVDIDGDAKVDVNNGTVESAACGSEVIGELSPETAEEIAANNMEDEIPEEETIDDLPFDEEPIEGEDVPEEGGEDIELDFDDFDEDSFNELSESYLKEVYENVESFNTSNVTSQENGLLVEGIIKFNSGKEKRTSFVFEADQATKGGKVRFNGLNEQISRGKKSFMLTGSLVDKKFISESLKYNYRAKNAEGESTRIYGTAKKA